MSYPDLSRSHKLKDKLSTVITWARACLLHLSHLVYLAQSQSHTMLTSYLFKQKEALSGLDPHALEVFLVTREKYELYCYFNKTKGNKEDQNKGNKEYWQVKGSTEPWFYVVFFGGS